LPSSVPSQPLRLRTRETRGRERRSGIRTMAAVGRGLGGEGWRSKEIGEDPREEIGEDACKGICHGG
jgi:hypothetical protein